MSRFTFTDNSGNGGCVITNPDGRVLLILDDDDGSAMHRFRTGAKLRALAGALLAAAQRIDPLPSTNPTPASTPDRLT